MKRKKFAKMIDHTLLKPDIIKDQVDALCREALEYEFFSVCLPPNFVSYAKNLLTPSVKVCTVVGFPLGYQNTQTKVHEAKIAIGEGADELDMVMNISALKNKEENKVLDDICAVVETGKLVKVIVETCLLNEEEKIKVCSLVKKSGAAFIKTSTGFSHKGAELCDIQLMKRELGDSVKIKASGGISKINIALQLIKEGVERLGTSRSVQLMKDLK